MRSRHSSSSAVERTRLHRGARGRSAGFTLIELMIGVLIGLLASLAVTQVMLNSEGQKRTTTSGSDAQVNGALALSALQRSIQSAGYGFAANPTSLGCDLSTNTFAGAAIAGFPATLAPIIITAGASGAPDTIRVIASGKTSYSIPLRVVPPGYNPAFVANKYEFPVAAHQGVEAGDLVIAVTDSTQPCEVFRVSSDPAVNPVVPRADDDKWNTAGRPTRTYSDGHSLINMGSFIDTTYNIGTSTYSLQARSLNIAADSTPSYPAASDLFPNVVNLKAMYGKDTNGDGVVDAWDNTTPTTNAGWRELLAVRIAVVARSTQYEKELVTSDNPSWDVGTAIVIPGAVTCGASKCLGLKVDGLADWQHYRYKVFETIVPLRNMLWNS